MAEHAHLGAYEIINRIASGGMGTVYLARHPGTNRTLAIKILSPQMVQNDEFVARFKREAQMVAALSHPNIVQVYDAGQSDDRYYIAMEYLPYGSLRSELSRFVRSGERMPIDRALEITRQVASALDHAHKRGLIHRDVKPSNIMRAAGDRYVLTDFGIALDTDATRLTRSPDSIGTPEYMSPEQVKHEGVDARSDIYALGVLLYELLAGTPPFKADQPMVTLMMQVHQDPEPVTRYRPDTPKGVSRLVARALAKQPEQRFQSAAAMAAAIVQILERGVKRRVILEPPKLKALVMSWRTSHRLGGRRIAATIGIACLALVGVSIWSNMSAAQTSAAIALLPDWLNPNPVGAPHIVDISLLQIRSPVASAPRGAMLYDAPGARGRPIGPLLADREIVPIGRDSTGQWIAIDQPIREIAWLRMAQITLTRQMLSAALPILPDGFPEMWRPYTATVQVRPMANPAIGAPTTLSWSIEGATSARISIQGVTHPAFVCPAGNLARLSPLLLERGAYANLPAGSLQLSADAAGYYAITFDIAQSNGQSTQLVRHIAVGCKKKADRADRRSLVETSPWAAGISAEMFIASKQFWYRLSTAVS